MAVYEATLTKTLSNGDKHYIYPKTNASIVKYGNTNVSAVLAIIQGNSSTSGSMDYKIAQFNTNTLQANYVAKTDIATTSAVGVVKIGSNISVDAAGTISVANASTSTAGVVQLNDSTSSTSTTQAATANAVKNAYNAATAVMGAASASAPGTAGRVPASAAGDQNKFLRADATWAEIPETYTHPTYTATTGIETGNQSVQLGESVNVSQVATDSTGHITSQTTRTITFTHPTYTAQTGVATTNQTPTFGGTFNIDQFTSDTSGHISGRTTRTVTIPATAATTDALGLVKIGTNITVNSGVISIANGSTSTKGVVQLSDSVSSTSITLAATANAVKTAYDKATTVYVGATSSAAGTAGIVPAATSAQKDYFLRGDGTWAGAGSSSYVFASSDETYEDYLGVFLDQSNNVLAYFDEYGNFHVTGNIYSANL